VLNIRSDFNGSATAVIYDVIGKQIRNISIEDGFTNVNTSEFKNGVYFYQIVDEKGLALSNGKFSIVR
jgi:predicted lipoprotein